MGDIMDHRWACLTCSRTFPIGKAFLWGGVGERSPGNDPGLNCPHCRSMNIHPADGTSHAGEFHGERGTLQ